MSFADKSNAFYEQRKDIIYNMIVFYTKNDKMEQWKQDITSQKDRELFTACMKDIVDRNIWYLDYLAVYEKEQKERQELVDELKRIKSSRWWKLREHLKRGK